MHLKAMLNRQCAKTISATQLITLRATLNN